MEGLLYLSPLYVAVALLFGASVTAGLFLFHVAVVPLIFKYSKTFRHSIVFANFVQWPLNIDYEDPSAYGIEGTRNFTIEYQSKVDKCRIKLGVWHVLPQKVHEKLKDCLNENDKAELHRILDYELSNSDHPIIMYCHGNSNSRAAHHRIKMYQFFQKMNFHTIAFDYRGYGDSTNISPSELGVVEDSLHIYEWLQNSVDKSDKKTPVFVWGHSLGTGISSHLLGELDKLSSNLLDLNIPLRQPSGLILESPFSNLADEVAQFPLSKLAVWLPYFDNAFLKPFRVSEEYSFKSDKYLSDVTSLPILILHAKDDYIVPFVVGAKLYKAIMQSRENSGATVTFHAYNKCQGYGHKWICTATDLHEVVGNFVNKHK